MSRVSKSEIKRKLFHLLSIGYAIAYWYLPKNTVLTGLIILFLMAAATEIGRRYSEAFNGLILKIFGSIMRESEGKHTAGVIWTLAGAIITILLFDNKACVFTAFLYLAFGDSAAALFGMAFGRHKIYGGKSLEGSFACFTVCLIVGLLVLPVWPVALTGALLAAFAETLPWPLSDNLWMQPVDAGFLVLMTFLFAA